MWVGVEQAGERGGRPGELAGVMGEQTSMHMAGRWKGGVRQVCERVCMQPGDLAGCRQE